MSDFSPFDYESYKVFLDAPEYHLMSQALEIAAMQSPAFCDLARQFRHGSSDGAAHIVRVGRRNPD